MEHLKKLNIQVFRMKSTLTISGLEASVNAKTGELCSIIKDGKEIMWGGGRPANHQSGTERRGWPHSAIIMFPLVGPAKKHQNGDFINYGVYHCPMVQHGIFRHIPIAVSKYNNEIRTYQQYISDKTIKTEKGPARWPYSCKLEARYLFNTANIEAQFIIENTFHVPIPFSFGWHPAFNTEMGFEINNHGEKFTLKDILKEKTLYLEKNSTVTYEDNSKRIDLEHTFGNIMIWNPKDAPLVCLEPVTGLPVRTGKETSGSYESCELRPGRIKDYYVKIIPCLK